MKKSTWRRAGLAIAGACAVIVHAPAAAQAAAPQPDLSALSLEELADVRISSVSRRSERLADAAAAVFVITRDEIRRSGYHTLPDILRLAPNLFVARQEAMTYGITARGFNSTTANKLLVLVDGRSVYTPLYSGVFWDAPDTLLEDIDRIEVVSGPGGTLWGANAVNGVINIITRSARETQGALAVVDAGSEDRRGAARWGGRLGDEASVRVYGKAFQRGDTDRPNGTSSRDDYRKTQGGFRIDGGRDASTYTLQGDIYEGSLGQLPALGARKTMSGANLLGRWNRTLATDSSLQVQAYYDRSERNYPGQFDETLDTFDLDIQHNFAAGPNHQVLWGGGARYSRDEVGSSLLIAFLPPRKTLSLANVFAQDTVALSDKLHLTLGARLEHNNYTGWEFTPNVRLAWQPAPDRTVWAALSRAVRTPSRLDRDFFSPPTPPFALLAGGPDFQSEKLTALDIGYRAQPNPRVSFTVAAYWNRYDDLRSVESVTAATIPVVVANGMKGQVSGLEAWGSWQVADWWRLSAGANLMHEKLGFKSGSRDIGGVQAAGNDPHHQFLLRSSMNLPHRMEFDVNLRAVGALPNPAIPSYTAVDLRWGWQATRNVELAVSAFNITDRGHVEFGPVTQQGEIPRSVAVKLTWRM
jgi:iron complex outermembrane receptor protein